MRKTIAMTSSHFELTCLKHVDAVRSVQRITDKLSMTYHETVEKWLRALGVTEETIAQYEFRTYPYQIGGELWHEGVKIGDVITRIDDGSPATGIRFVVECTSPQTIDSKPQSS